MAYYIYILRCGDGTLYTGSTNDVQRRLEAHQRGRGAKYTRSRLPVELVYQEALPDKSEALRREAAIKKLSRSEKLTLIEGEKRITMQEMRRKDRQLPEEAAWEITDRCLYTVLSMTAEDGSVYAVPVHVVREGRDFYFHCAREGRKSRCLQSCPQVCLTFVEDARVVQEHFTTYYRSAVAFGTAEEVTDLPEKTAVLEQLCCRYTPDMGREAVDRELGAAPHTAVWRIRVETITGKHNG